MSDKADSLNNLPPLEPPPALWAAVRTELDQRRRQRVHQRRIRRLGAVGAIAALVLVAVLLQPFDEAIDTGRDSDQVLIETRQLSALLESQIRQHAAGTVSAESVERLVWLEDELAWLDTRLAANPDNSELWLRRARLLVEMNRIYSRNDWQSQMRLTSY
jgi:hypothetical protein